MIRIDNTHSTVETENFKIIIEHRKEINQNSKTPLIEGLKNADKIHTVVKGDTLWHIAKKYFGDPFLYPTIAQLSKINDPDLIYPGDIICLIRKTNKYSP